ncbi:hypothetical protein [Piscinibacter gummiphilus]|uniref:Uncharacterized protein n=1 Tax=Piscinibacter gummiphilus TaxID=946333 RepID=A0ABZ0CYY6_9BURK|nr:hypothetical protein [Piscinibacter gummiphilus]WOB10118.1 hypothetical protein RXV79_08635 [Piscinibacter gummiphilus]
MDDLATALAIAFAIPLSLLVGVCAWLVCYRMTSTAAAGTVTFVSVRLWIDDDTAPADRYFAPACVMPHRGWSTSSSAGGLMWSRHRSAAR